MTPDQVFALRTKDNTTFNLKVYAAAYCITLTDIADPRCPESIALLQECVRAFLDGIEFSLPDVSQPGSSDNSLPG
jgi:hypothetical protein